MVPPPLPSPRALLSRLLLLANQGVPWEPFFEAAGDMLLEPSGCECLEVILASEIGPFRFRLGESERFRASRDDYTGNTVESNLDFLRRSLGPASSQPTDLGSFFHNDARLEGAPETRSVAIIPMALGLERHGVLLLHCRQPGFFSDEVVAGWELLGESLMTAISFEWAAWSMRERLKELNCLYAIAQIVDEVDVPLPEMLQRIASRIPGGFIYPESCGAEIRVDGLSCSGGDTRAAASRMVANILVAGKRRGTIEVTYSEPHGDIDEGPFLREERVLLEEVARQVARAVRRRNVEDESNRLQEQLRHSDRLATIGQLAAGVAHELNEPLGAILGFAQLANKTPRLPRQVSQDIDRIIKAALYARDVVKKLMVFGRQTPPQKSQVDLNRLVREGLDFVRPRCQSEGIELRFRLGDDLPQITADPNQLHQVLVNLVVNAVQATGSGGTVVISTHTSPGAVHLVVEDNGQGMTEEVLKHVFLPFFTTKEVGQGTGLGLAVVHGIVTAHGGTIHVDSTPGRGTRFDVRLPATAQEPIS